MGRWCPPPPKTSAYITQEGAGRLQAELKQLWKVERPEVTAVLKAAVANGDRSENGDYIYGKQRLRELDRRIRYLSKRLDVLTVVDRLPRDQSKVFFGAWVSLENDQGEEFTVRIVGYDEIDAKLNWISLDSPLAQAVLGKRLDDEVKYPTPEGQKEACIVDIKYKA